MPESSHGTEPIPDDPVQRLEAVDAVFSALAHASRRQILLVIHHRGGRMASGEIARRFGCSWPTTTRHLRILEEAGLVRVTREGRGRVYGLVHRRLEGIASAWLRSFGPSGGREGLPG